MIDIDVAKILPHAGKIILIDKVLEYDQESLTAELFVRDDYFFGDGLSVPAWLGVEYMAQTVAAHGGMMRYLVGKPINLGFLLGTRRYTTNVSTIQLGTCLSVKVSKLVEDQGLSVFECYISGTDIDISAKLNVYQPDQVKNRVMI